MLTSSSAASTRKILGFRSSGVSRKVLPRSNSARIGLLSPVRLQAPGSRLRAGPTGPEPGVQSPKPAAHHTAVSLLHDQIPLHLLVERRAEVRAVIREHARLVRLEGERLRLA